MGINSIRILQISNVSPAATKEQIQTLFSYIGRIEECRIYPSYSSAIHSKFAYVKFEDERGVDVGQHLTNTVFLDRALICVPAQSNTIPEEDAALQVVSILPGQQKVSPNMASIEEDRGDGVKIYTMDPMLKELGLPEYPPLPAGTDLGKVEEIRRTVYVGNLEKDCDPDELMNFFNMCIGEVMYLRMAAGNLPYDFAYVEFTNQSSVPMALQNSDSLEFRGRPLKIQHSKVALLKPRRKTVEQALEEVEVAIKIGEARDKVELGRGYSPARGSRGRSPDRYNSGSRRCSRSRRSGRSHSHRKKKRHSSRRM